MEQEAAVEAAVEAEAEIALEVEVECLRLKKNSHGNVLRGGMGPELVLLG